MDRRINLLAVAWCINTFAYSIAYPFLPLYLHSTRGFPMPQVGLMYLLMGLSRTLAPPVSGPLIDRFGRRFMLVYSPVLRGLLFMVLAALVAVEAGFWWLALMLFLVMFVGTFFQNASDAYVTDITPPEQRAEAFSRVRVGLNLGWMAGPAVGGFLARTPFAALFAATGVLCLITPLVVARHCPEQRRSPSRADDDDPQSLTGILIGDRDLRRLLVCAFPLLLVSSQLISTLSVFAKEQIGMSGNQIGLLYTVNGLLVILLQIAISRAIGRVNLATQVTIGSLFYAAGYFSLAFAQRPAHAFLAVGIFTFGEMLVFPALVSAVSRQAPPRLVGRYMGLYGLTWGLGYSIGPFLGSLLYARFATSPIHLWGIIVSAGLVAGAGFTRLTKIPAMQAAPRRRQPA